MATKLRVLCLHGYRQNGLKLRGRIAALRRAFKSTIDFVSVDAPVIVPYEPTNEEHANRIEQQQTNTEDPAEVAQYAWWNYRIDEATGDHEYSRVEESVAYISRICEEQGPFDGIFGFSQGGMMAAMLLHLQFTQPQQFPFAFSFAILVAAAAPKDPRYAFGDSTFDIPSLHMMGVTDAVVDVARSRLLAQVFVDPTIVEHPGGHFIPTNKVPKDAMRAFVKDLFARRQHD